MLASSRIVKAVRVCRIQDAPNNLTVIALRMVTVYITLFTNPKPTGCMEEEENTALSHLGRQPSLFGAGNSEKIAELEEKIAELERRLMMMQGETIGSIEALQRRLLNLEDNRSIESVLDVMSPEELNDIAGTKIGEWPEYEDDGEEVKVVESGFTFANDIEDSPTIADINELQISINNVAEAVNQISPGTLEIPQDEELRSHEECAQAIIDHINEHGGIANADWKKKGLIPDSFEYEDRVKVRDIVAAEEGITYWKRNNMWWFYYREEEGLEAAHERVYGTLP